MFYSHEVLTSRKYGFATVWLVATMGPGAKKVSRKAILSVDVGKTCETIAEPAVPLALRLQSSLLYGVAKIYSQQCNYVLSDVESARNHMRAVLKAIRVSALDATGSNTARAQHLILADDPDFLPELDLTILDTFPQDEFSYLQFPASNIEDSSRTGESQERVGLGENLLLQSIHSPAAALQLPDLFSDAFNTTPRKEQQYQYYGLHDNLDVVPDVGATIVQPEAAETLHTSIGTRSDDNGATHLADYIMSVADRSSPTHVDGREHNSPFHQAEEIVTTSETIQAHQHRAAVKKILANDSSIELSNAALKKNQEEYLQRMLQKSTYKQVISSNTMAKKNANHWLIGNGDSCVPMAAYEGWNMVRLIFKLNSDETFTKRQREESPGRHSQRRVKPREADHAMDGQDFDMLGYTEIEHGREQPTPLDDHQHTSFLPWNQSTVSHRPASLMSFGGGQSVSQHHSRYGTSPLAARVLQASLAGPTTLEHVMQDHLNDSIDAYPEVHEMQTATDSQWARSTLFNESTNFLGFIKDHILQRQENVDINIASTTFDELLPAMNHNYIVAAQALLHILALGTRNLLLAEQEIAFGQINIIPVTKDV